MIWVPELQIWVLYDDYFMLMHVWKPMPMVCYFAYEIVYAQGTYWKLNAN